VTAPFEPSLPPPLARLLRARRGHFVFESGHHGDLWLELERLFLRPEAVRPLARELAALVRPHQVELVCGPLVEGAFVGMMVAAELDVPFVYSQPHAEGGEGLFPVKYRVPGALRAEVTGRRVAIVNDVINAGSAVRGTFADLAPVCQPVVIAALLVLGEGARAFASESRVALEALAVQASALWLPADCPLCAAGAPITD
jgi:orotate phosphoribosyltransferase